MHTLLLSALTLAAQVPDTAPLQVHVDSAARAVVVEYQVPLFHADADVHAAHAGHEGGAHVRRLLRFAWPVSGWLRGARVEVRDADGAELPQRLVHHVNLVNFDRQQLVHPAVERLYAAGQETGAILLPRTVGVPVPVGARLGVLAAYDPGTLAGGSRIRIHLTWTPDNQVPRPLGILPLLLDVGFRPGETPAYELPPGPSRRAFEFRMPVSGRVLGVGGHLHDHGQLLRLEEAESGKVVFELAAVHDSAGRLVEVPRQIFGATGRGRRLLGGRSYRLVVLYDNPTGAVIPEGAMGEMALLFAPDDRRLELTVERSREEIQLDLAGLAALEPAAGTP